MHPEYGEVLVQAKAGRAFYLVLAIDRGPGYNKKEGGYTGIHFTFGDQGQCKGWIRGENVYYGETFKVRPEELKRIKKS